MVLNWRSSGVLLVTTCSDSFLFSFLVIFYLRLLLILAARSAVLVSAVTIRSTLQIRVIGSGVRTRFQPASAPGVFNHRSLLQGCGAGTMQVMPVGRNRSSGATGRQVF